MTSEQEPTPEPKKRNFFEKFEQYYNKNYKKLIYIPLIVLIISVSFLSFTKLNTGEFISKDISLKGGYLITVETNNIYTPKVLEQNLENELGLSINVKELKSLTGGDVGYTFEIETGNVEQIKEAISSELGFELNEQNHTFEETSSTLGATFFRSMLKALIIAFVFMSLVVFYYFRKLVPSGAIVFAAASDIISTLAIMGMLGMTLSTSGIAALLMLVGYSVDSDILLSTKVLKRKEFSLNERFKSAFKTGITMQITTVAALIAIYLTSPTIVLKQIAIVLLIGILLDMLNTWIMNASVLKIYVEKNDKL